MRIWAVVRFIGSLFKTKTGASGLFLVLLKPLWNILSVWQSVDFLPSRMMPLWDFLNGFWGPFALMAVGFLLIGKAVYDRWPETQESDSQGLGKAPTNQPTPESQQPPTPAPPQ